MFQLQPICKVLTQTNKVFIITALFIVAACAGNTSVHTFGDTIDITRFNGIVELNTDAISGEVKDNSMLRLKIESNIAQSLREKYKSVGSYSVFLVTASKEERKLSNHLALRNRGYTHLLVAAINPEKTYTGVKQEGKTPGTHSLNISCTIYRLMDGMPVSLVNIDVYKANRNDPAGNAGNHAETLKDRWQAGSIDSCDLALDAVIR